MGSGMNASQYDDFNDPNEWEQGASDDPQRQRIENLERAIQHFVNLHPQYRAYFATATGITHSEGAAA